MPQISVIIPTYNRAAHVTKAIDSVLSQTYKDYEIIVIDDGSTDDTQTILAPYKDKINYIFQCNAGVSAARNKGIRSATGEWIAFLDSDDTWEPDKLLKQLRFNIENSLDISFTNFHFNSDPKVNVDSFIDEPLSLFLLRDEKLFIQTVLVKKIIMPIFDEALFVCEDIKAFYLLSNRTKKFGYIGSSLASITRSANIHGLTNDTKLSSTYHKAYDSFLVHYQALCLCRNNDVNYGKAIKSHMNFHLFLAARSSYLLYGYRKSFFLMTHSLISSTSILRLTKSIFLLFFPITYKIRHKKNKCRPS